MAIRVTCHSCNGEINVKDELAGKDILCPTCQQRVTVPSLATGRPEPRPAPEPDVDERLEDRERRRSGGRDDDLPRWRDGDDLPSRRDTSRWNGTLTGLALIFWAWLFITIIFVIFQGVGLAIGSEAAAFNANPGGQPPPAVMLFGVLTLGFVCVGFVLLILAFVGLCMCCTVPAESGAKGKAIASLILVIVTVLGLIIFGVVIAIVAFDHIQRFGPLRPGQMPISGSAMMVATVVFGLDFILLASIWLLFHKALADHFQNSRLSRTCIWYLVAYISINLASTIFSFIANPTMFGGDLANAPVVFTPLIIVAGVIQVATFAALMTWYLFIIRETRRTIQEDQPIASGAAPGGDEYR